MPRRQRHAAISGGDVVTDKPVTNIAHSVRQRLLNEAKRTGRLYNEIEQYYAIERFLYRLSQSEHSDSFVLKGALLFTAWHNRRFRATRDIDLLGRLSNSQGGIAQLFRDVCSQSVPDDGLLFDPSSVTTVRIAEDAEYEGVRVTVDGRLGTGRVRIQVDIGFSDVIVPAPVEIDYPGILDFPSPHLKAYSRESVVAEKLEALVTLGEGNSRMKDFADLWFLARHFSFDGRLLAQAVRDTFEKRQTPVQTQPMALTPAFAQIAAKQAQWKAFLRRSSPEGTPTDLADVIDANAIFLLPILAHLAADEPLPRTWDAPGPWQM